MKIGMRAAKAYVGAGVALFAALGTALADDAVSSAEAVGAVGSALAAFAAVYFAPNGPDSSHRTSTPEVGG